jgi:hypothetical protein
MRYMILIHSNPQSRAIWEGFSEAEQAEGLKVYSALNADLVSSGELVAAEALADPSQGKRIPAQEGQSIASDGPFAEAKEELAGFYLVDCESEQRAIEIAERIPEAGLGLVEVRPIMHYAGLEM